MTKNADAAKAIATLDYHINANLGGPAETALRQARYQIMTSAGLNGVDDVEPFDPEAKAPTKAANAAVVAQLQGFADEAVNAGQAAPFTEAIGVLGGGEDDDAEA
jgi:hypothetical protein